MGDSKLGRWLGVDGKYASFCREERNYAAVLYHLLLDTRRLQRFLELLRIPDVDPEKVALYFEYAHLRDLWAEGAVSDIPERNRRYREAIIKMLGFPEIPLPQDVHMFNQLFIGKKRAASEQFIQMPRCWDDGRFLEWKSHAERESHDDGTAFARRACRLKWAFNAKPDLVLNLGDNKALCIEAKLDSGTSVYHVKGRPPEARTCRTGQLELQEFIMEDLLGYQTTFAVISRRSRPMDGSKWQYYSWQQIFTDLLSIQPDPASESRIVAEFSGALDRGRPV